MIKRKVKYLWIWLGIAALVIRYLFVLFPDLGHLLYRLFTFPFIRLAFDNTLGRLPFSGFWVLLGAVILFLAYKFFFKKRRTPILRERFFGLFNVVGFIVFWFLLLWGFHYPLPDFREMVDLETEEPLILETFYRSTLTEAEMNRSFVLEGHLSDIDLPENYREKILDEVKNVLKAANFPTTSEVRVRETGNGFVRRLGIHGFYLPFTGEGIVDGSLTTIPRIFTFAHEAAHGYGVTNEGEANFVAYAALKSSNEHSFNYIADFVLFRHLLFSISRNNPEEFEEIYAEIPEGILSDINHITTDKANHPRFFPELATTVNNAYLYSQGVDGGIESYGELVSLAYGWNFKKREFNALKEEE